MRKGVCMKKKLVVMAVLLSAICFTGFAQEAFNSEAPRYIAKESEEKEYTVVVEADVWKDGKATHDTQTFTIIAKDKSAAEKEAIKRFKTWHGDSKGNNLSRLMVRCTSTKDACRL